jgi:hypothetical protein
MKDQVRDIIREKLLSLINRRERAYKSIVEKGSNIPDYDKKVRAINAIRIQLEASRDWDLQSNLRWIHAMREQIHIILPFEFHDDQKQRLYRERLLNLLRYCDDLLDTKPLFS